MRFDEKLGLFISIDGGSEQTIKIYYIKKKKIIATDFVNFFLYQIDCYYKILLIGSFLKSLKPRMRNKMISSLDFELFYHAFGLILFEFFKKILKRGGFILDLSFQCKVLPKNIKLCREFIRNNVNLIKFQNFNLQVKRTKNKKSNEIYPEQLVNNKNPFSMLELSMLTKKKRNLLNKEAREIHHLVSGNLAKLNSMLHSKIHEQIFFIEQVYDHSLENYKNLTSTQKNFLPKKKKLFFIFNLNILTLLILFIIFLTEVIN